MLHKAPTYLPLGKFAYLPVGKAYLPLGKLISYDLFCIRVTLRGISASLSKMEQIRYLVYSRQCGEVWR